MRYDSGFAPNPFYGICTLATCKPDIRKSVDIGDWVVGSGSADRKLNRGGYLVCAMRVTEALTIQDYWEDPRFARKKPNLSRSRMQACGDNIYHRLGDGSWAQLPSFHSHKDGSPNPRHIQRDTGVNRVLISEDFAYFGGEGPKIPEALRDSEGRGVCVHGRGRKVFKDQEFIEKFISWIQSLGVHGYIGEPMDWVLLR